MKIVKIGEVSLGQGRPKLCVSLTGKNLTEVIQQAKVVGKSVADIVEWRLDFLDPELTVTEILQALPEVGKYLNQPILITFRTAEEGGERYITTADYLLVARALIESQEVVALDLEVGIPGIADLLGLAQKNETTIILSSHDFNKTPSQKEIVRRLHQMEALGGDIAKIAVMPQTAEDVVTLLAATVQGAQEISLPVVTMSMGPLGKISRVSGATFGSAMTFGSVGQGSAPGQLEVETLAKMLDQLA